VQGQHVGADQAYAKSMGPAFKRAGGMESREITDMNGSQRQVTAMVSLLTLLQVENTSATLLQV
jgi:transcription factor IIIB subunit 2